MPVEAWNHDWQTWETKDLYTAYQALSRERPEDYPTVKTFEQFEHVLANKNPDESVAFLGRLHNDYRVLLRQAVQDGIEVAADFLID